MQPLFEVYLGLGLASLMWVMLYIDLASTIGARIDDLTAPSDAAPHHALVTVLGLLRLLLATLGMVLAVVFFWPLLSVPLLRGNRHQGDNFR